jgi:hypothetical protein
MSGKTPASGEAWQRVEKEFQEMPDGDRTTRDLQGVEKFLNALLWRLR